MRIMNRRPDRAWTIVLAALPFFAVVLAYTIASGIRLAENPTDKLLPSFSAMAEAWRLIAFVPDPRSGLYILMNDTAVSLSLLLTALAISTAIALLAGIVIGLLPLAGAAFGPIVAVASMIPPLALLPILFIALGLGAGAKIALIVIGTTLKLARDMVLRVEDIPREQLIKAQTLGASTWQIATRIVLPQMLPRLIDSVRLELGPAWLFLIAAEAIAADAGLGYRIFLLRRYLAMDVIIPYVIWITLLAFAMDWLLKVTQRKLFPWFEKARAQ